MKFIKVKNTKIGIEYDWLADIQSIPELMEIEETFSVRNANNLWDFLKSKDYAYAMNKTFEGNPVPIDGDHCKPGNKLAPYFLACISNMPEGKVHPIVYFAEKLSAASAGKVKALNEFGRILINKNGGFFTWSDSLEILDSCEAKRFPQYSIKDISVSKWPEGKHWYITCNDTPVIIDDTEKYNTEAEAWKAANKWLKQKNT